MEATTPLLMIVDLATSLAASQALAVAPSHPISQQITKHLLSTMTAGEVRVYEQVRLKTIQCLAEELQRTAPRRPQP